MVAARKPSPLPPRVIWAEDALDEQFLIRHALNQVRDAPQVTFVSDGVAAILAVEAQRPDLLVLDINMPRMDGLTALREVRERANGKDLPVVVFSTAREERDVATAQELGVKAFVQKPGPFQEFCSAVDGVLAHAGRPASGGGARLVAKDLPAMPRYRATAAQRRK